MHGPRPARTPLPGPSRMPKHTVVVSLIAGILASSQAVHAQVPGYQRIDPRSVRAEYLAEVLERINELNTRWGEAWSRDDAAALADLYWEDAILIPAGSERPLRGRDAIRAHFEATLPVQGRAEAFLLDFDAGGEMAQVFGNYLIAPQPGVRGVTALRGPMVTVYMRRGRRWGIRSQVFVGG